MCVYAWGNNIFNNPGISYNKAHRSDQEARDDDPNSLQRSKRYTSGIFRRLGDVRACFPPGTGCMRSLLVNAEFSLQHDSKEVTLGAL